MDGKKVAEVKEKGILMIKASDFNLRQIMNVDVSAYFEIVLGKLVASSDVVNSKKWKMKKYIVQYYSSELFKYDKISRH